MIQEVSRRLADIRQKMIAAARRSGRSEDNVVLVAITKTVDPQRIQEAVNAGVAHLGENRIQEAKTKREAVRGNVHWHMVGHLQTNKVKEAVSLFEMIQSVDRWDLAEKLSKEGEKQGKIVEGLVQVNVAGEATKGGWKVEEVPEAMASLAGLTHLRLRGLMTIAPYTAHPEETRPVFRRLKQLFDGLALTPHSASRIPHWNCLSMGMSNDFEIAIEEGSTMVRIGTAIFGERTPKIVNS